MSCFISYYSHKYKQQVEVDNRVCWGIHRGRRSVSYLLAAQGSQLNIQICRYQRSGVTWGKVLWEPCRSSRVPRSTHSKFVTSTGRPIHSGIFFKDCSTVQYASADDAIKMILNLGRGCFPARTDLRNAFRILPLRPVEYHMFGFVWNNLYFYDRALCMGGGGQVHV